MNTYFSNFAEWVIEDVSKWLLQESPPKHGHLSDLSQVCKEIRPCDILLIEGRSRASSIIKQVTQSPWSHAALYIGRLENINNLDYREQAARYGGYPEATQLLIESEIGLGTIISPVEKYNLDHVRILRPRGLNKAAAQQVINFAIGRIGRRYDIRHLMDLARFLFPWGLFPRRWRSTLFQHNALQPTKDICSSMIASAFQCVNYPILPIIRKNDKKEVELIERNSNLYTPSDFDYSPFFDVIKYPILPLDEQGEYKNLNWNMDISDDESSDNYPPLEE
jgi:hypothetical protein